MTPLFSGQGLTWSVTAAQEKFPLLIGQTFGYGSVLGIGYYYLSRRLDQAGPSQRSVSADQTPGQPKNRLPTPQPLVPPLIRALIIGGLGGLGGGWLFLQGIETAEFFPLVAGLLRSDSMVVGQILHYLIGTTIGVSFGLLFHRDIQGLGSSLIWGLNYGLVWWVIGPMFLMPLFLGAGVRPEWSLPEARANVPSLAAHLLYGVLVGLFYALVNKVWTVLFVDSDPLRRAAEGAGARGVRSVLMGQAGGVIGGLLFTTVMVGVGLLPQVAGLVAAESVVVGFFVHLIIAVIIGSSYGLLFQREAYSYGAGLAWGLVYGLIWWLLGAMTLFPIFLGEPVTWSLPAVVAAYPTLIGHLLYGAGLGFFFQFLARRYDYELSGRARLVREGSRLVYQTDPTPRRRAAGTPAYPLWLVTLLLGILLPLLLANVG